VLIPVSQIATVLERYSSVDGVRWYRQMAERLPTAYDRAGFLEAFTAVGRRLGKSAIGFFPDERVGLGTVGSLDGWTADVLGRAGLLLVVSAGVPEVEFEALVNACFDQGELGERRAVLRALSLLPKPERFVPLAVEACRSHVQVLFEAIACENPYPAAYFPELNFNQLVLKVLFLGISVERIVGFQSRLTAELARMARAYESERRAAGRSVPADIGLLVTGERSVS
jgi:hypothetical protein